MMPFNPLLIIALVVGIGVAVWLIFFRKKSDSSTVTTPAPQPLPTPGWQILYSPGMPAAPVAEGAGWYFDFPVGSNGSVHYVVNPVGAVAVAGKRRIIIDFKITGDAPVFEQTDRSGGDAPASVRVMLQRAGDTLAAGTPEAPTQYVDYRYWSEPINLQVGDGVFDVYLDDVVHWSNVFGRKDAAGFAACLANLANVALTFGGVFAGHGVQLSSGSAQFHLLGLRFE